ncbi:MAG TPA: DUF2130 domain-containing protein [Amphiplicatus sp.]|nr:DUF2130 domain-containing protein [Amphiplicatus sp.]MCB9956150.1 DUF2130 domain-containing protein [Caulobacterales bacterium]HOP18457.1 DUF2130 domain-containing protein [Amphiplicatus sp.]
MPSSQSNLLNTPGAGAGVPHFHRDDDLLCPLCEQPIPDERADEIQERIALRENERNAAVEARLKDLFAREKSEAVSAARAAERKAADEKAAKKIADAESVHRQMLVEIQRGAEKARADHEAALAKAEAEKKSALAAAEAARQDAVARMQASIDEAQRLKEAAEKAQGDLRTQLDQAGAEKDAAIAAAREDAGRAHQEQLAEVLRAKVDAEAKAAQAEKLREEGERARADELAARLAEQREALEKAAINAVNAEKSKAFDDKLKLSGKIDDLQRALDKKTAEERGEGAEIDLFEALKAAFEGDKIERINKGQPGADIRHTVMRNGKACGKILYDSKDHKAWRNDFVIKLASDKVADKAEHAILSTRTFPAGSRQLDSRDGVIIASPARIVALVGIVREHMIRVRALQLSDEARERKTEALYAFMTSDRCDGLFKRIDGHAEELLTLQDKERRAHEAMWKREGELYRSVQKANADMRNEVDLIIGTAGGGDA